MRFCDDLTGRRRDDGDRRLGCAERLRLGSLEDHLVVRLQQPHVGAGLGRNQFECLRSLLGVLHIDHREPRGCNNAGGRERSGDCVATERPQTRGQRNEPTRLQVRAHRVGSRDAIVGHPPLDERRPVDRCDHLLLVAREKRFFLEEANDPGHRAERGHRAFRKGPYSEWRLEVAECSHDARRRCPLETSQWARLAVRISVGPLAPDEHRGVGGDDA